MPRERCDISRAFVFSNIDDEPTHRPATAMGKRKQRDPGGYAADGGTDGYPPPPLLENEHFETYYRGLGLVPPSEWDAFLAALRTPLGVSFRITGRPDDPTALALRDWMERKHVQRMQQLVVPGAGAVPPPTPIPWLPGRLAWRFDVSRATLRGKGVRRADADGPAQDPTPEEAASKSTLAAFHEFLTQEVELGNMSRQEEVSMVPPEVLEVRPGQRVLDMCAAPGSKTQQLLECSAGSLAATCGGMVIANDAEYRRCHLLVHQAKRLNSPLLVVTNHDAQMLPTRLDVDGSGRLRFDRILCDVPCSGDGTLRKCPDLWRRWNEKLAWGVHRPNSAPLCRRRRPGRAALGVRAAL